MQESSEPFGYSLDARTTLATSASRGQDNQRIEPLAKGEIAEFTLEDGSVWYADPEDVAELFQSSGSRATRSETEGFRLLPGLFESGAVRGDTKLRIKAVTIGPIKKLGDLKEGLQKFGSTVIDETTFQIARLIEKKVLEFDGQSQLCNVRFTKQSDIELEKITAPLPQGADPWLLLIHGTFSSTKSAFGQIWKSCPGSFKRLREKYEKRTIALEHCTLTESPIENALEVLKKLPNGATLEILSHSRGGLVGEILCRSGRKDAAFAESEIEFFEREQHRKAPSSFQNELAQYTADEIQRLREINELIHSKNINVKRFVMVGCPARGTTLASEKLHRWANRLLNVAGLVPALKTSIVYQAIKAFILGTIENTTDPLSLPGIAAQMPESALVKVLNSSKPIDADLSAVTCNFDGQGWKRIPVWFADRFFGGDHDLVVNTASMDGGTSREKPVSVFHIDDNRTHHLNYFSNKYAVKEMVTQLTKGNSKSFQPPQKKAERSWGLSKQPAIQFGEGPNLIVLPGIMGSELSRDGNKIWVDYFDLAMGGFSRLSANAPGISATRAYPKYYSSFLQKFKSTHHVLPFPYDWRMPLEHSANQLAEKLRDLLNQMRERRTSQPIRIVAHSMGGLVVRMLQALDEKLWNRAMEHPESRFLMAGTPNRGSYAIPRSFVGEEGVVRSLALLDLTKGLEEFARDLRQFRGMMDMMPDFGEHRWFEESIWEQIKFKDGTSLEWNGSGRTDDENLRASKDARRKLNQVSFDPEKTIYIAGQSDVTPSDATIKDNQIYFRKSKLGDGQVTWESGIPQDLDHVYYQPTEHGELLSDTKHFDAWQQLVETGQTNLLSKTPPSFDTHRDVIQEKVAREYMLPDHIDYLPSDSELYGQAMGTGRARHKGGKFNPNQSRLEVFVTHGDLRFAQYPVVVGHYTDDSIVHAERDLDRCLDGKLSLRHKTSEYPGPIGTSEVVLLQRSEANRFPDGAIVVGIGLFGELTSTMLQRTITSGLVKYALEINELPPEIIPPKLGVSLLLIGTGLAKIAIHDAVFAIINAANEANQRLRDVDDSSLRLINRVEIIDYWEDVALQAADALTNAKNDQQYTHIDFDEHVRHRPGRLRRTHVQLDSNWFHNIRVNARKTSQGEDVLVYSDGSRLARNERDSEQVSVQFVNRFLDMIMDNVNFQQTEIDPHKTLFEMLLPNRIKDNSPDSDRVRFILDKSAARFPWEMLVDGWSQQGEPLAYNKRIIRQLETNTFRDRPQPAAGNKVLVVGDPPGGPRYPQLHGARQEAELVAGLFEEFGSYDVKRIISPVDRQSADPEMALRILNSLLSEENFILHFAAHGTFSRHRPASNAEQDSHLNGHVKCKCGKQQQDLDSLHGNDKEQGMVIGPGQYLTPAMVNKMRRVPTLVFLNCCHLGFIGENEEGTHRSVEFSQIATNLATQFIEMGTKLVIAAGWSVDDAAAQTFAHKFYSSFLSGESFADAVYHARRDTYDRHRGVNTFGAYQAWGDHEFKLRSQSNQFRAQEKKFASASVCVTEANNIRYRAKSNSNQEMSFLCEEANLLLEYLLGKYERKKIGDSSRWDRSAVRALVGLGRSYGEVGAFRSAIVLIEKAHRENASAMTIRDLEQLANFKCRLALELHADGETFLGPNKDGAKPKDATIGSAEHWVEAGIEELYDIIENQEISERSENYPSLQALLASAIRRKVSLLDPTEKVSEIQDCLTQVFLHYASAWLKQNVDNVTVADVISMGVEKGCEPDRYHFGSLILTEAIFVLFDNSSASFGEEFVELTNRFLTKLQEKQNRPAVFWDAVGPTHISLVQMLHPEFRRQTRGLEVPADDSVDQQLQEIQDVYRDVKERFAEVKQLDIGSVRQWMSLYDETHFVRSMLHKVLAIISKRKANAVQKEIYEFVDSKLADLESTLRRYSGRDTTLPEWSEEKLRKLMPEGRMQS